MTIKSNMPKKWSYSPIRTFFEQLENKYGGVKMIIKDLQYTRDPAGTSDTTGPLKEEIKIKLPRDVYYAIFEGLYAEANHFDYENDDMNREHVWRVIEFLERKLEKED